MSVPDEQRRAGRIVAEALQEGKRQVQAGVDLVDVAERVEGHIRSEGAELAFPLNISIDARAAHYTPRSGEETTFETGQIVKLDVGAHVDGYIGDAAVTVEVGGTRHARLIRAAELGLEKALSVIRGGVQLGTIGQTVESAIASHGFRPISNLTGHTIERYNLHAGTSIPSVPQGGRGRLETGTICAVEPFSTDGRGKIENGEPGNIYHFLRRRPVKGEGPRELLDLIEERYDRLPFAERWCARELGRPVQDDLERLTTVGAVKAYPILIEVDRGLVAQAEHTIHVTDDGVEILTRT